MQKSHKRVLMILMGGSAPFQIETGRWKSVSREERLCRECGMNEVEGYDHWLLWCSRWDIERQHLPANVPQLQNMGASSQGLLQPATETTCQDSYQDQE